MRGGFLVKEMGIQANSESAWIYSFDARSELLLWAWSSAGCLPGWGCNGVKTFLRRAHSFIHSFILCWDRERTGIQH